MGHHHFQGEPYDGEVSEWFMEPVLKTGDPARDRGFESHPLRHIFSQQDVKSVSMSLRIIAAKVVM